MSGAFSVVTGGALPLVVMIRGCDLLDTIPLSVLPSN